MTSCHLVLPYREEKPSCYAAATGKHTETVQPRLRDHRKHTVRAGQETLLQPFSRTQRFN